MTTQQQLDKYRTTNLLFFWEREQNFSSILFVTLMAMDTDPEGERFHELDCDRLAAGE